MVDFGMQKISIQLLSGSYTAKICSKSDWKRISRYKQGDNAEEICRDLIIGSLPPAAECALFIFVYAEKLKEIRTEVGFEVPYYQVKPESDDIKYMIYTSSDKLVADYANMDIYAVDKLPILDYWLLERDAFIRLLSGTKKGREYLNNAYRITQTEADEDIEI